MIPVIQMVLMASAGRAVQETTITVTEGAFAAPDPIWYGYDDGQRVSAFGARSPTTLNGATIISLVASDFSGSIFSFAVGVDGNVPQNHFATCTPEGGSKLIASAASYQYVGGGDYSEWVWSIGSLPTGWDGTGTRTVLFQY